MDSVEKERFRFKLPKITRRGKLLLLVVLSGSVLYFTSHDSSSIYTQINNPNLEK